MLKFKCYYDPSRTFRVMEYKEVTKGSSLVKIYSVILTASVCTYYPYIAIWFRYDLSAITVRYVDHRKPLYHFITMVKVEKLLENFNLFVVCRSVLSWEERSL